MSKLPHISIAGLTKLLFVVGFALAFVALTQFEEISFRDAVVNESPLRNIRLAGVPLGRNLKIDNYMALGLLVVLGILVFRVVQPLIEKRIAKKRRPVLVRENRLIFAALFATIIGFLIYAFLNAKVDAARQNVFVNEANDHLITMAYSQDLSKLVGGSESGLAYVWQDRQRDPAVLNTHFANSFSAAVYAPSGDLLALGSADSSVRLFSVDGTALKSQIKQGHGAVTVLAFGPDKRILSLAVGYSDGAVALWHISPTGESISPVWTTNGVHDAAVTTLAFDPNNRFLATGGGDHEIRVLDLTHGQYASRPTGNPDKLVGVVFSKLPGSPLRLAGLSEDAVLTSYDYRLDFRQPGLSQVSGSAPSNLNGTRYDQTTNLQTAAFNPQNQIYATARMDGQVDIRRFSDNCIINSVKHSSRVNSVAFDAGGNYLITGEQNGLVHVWTLDPDTLQSVRKWSRYCPTPASLTKKYPKHQEISANKGHPVSQVAWNDKTGISMLAITNQDNTALVCNHVLPTETTTCRTIQGPTDDITHVAFGSADENVIVTVTRDGYVRAARLNDNNTLSPLSEMGWMDAPIHILAPKPNSSEVVVGNTQGALRVWNWDTSTFMTNIFQRHAEISAEISAMTFNAEGDRLATADQDGNLTLWLGPDLADPRILRVSPDDANSKAHTGRITALAFSPDKKYLASADLDAKENIHVWRLEDNKLEQKLTAPGMNITHLVFSPDASKIAVSGDDSTAMIVPRDGSAPTSFDAHVVPMALELGPGNQLVAAGMNGDQLQEWNVVNLDTTTLPGTNTQMESALMGTPLLRFMVAVLVPFGLVFLMLLLGMRQQGTKIAGFLFNAHPNYDPAKGRQYVIDVLEGKEQFKQIVRGGELKVEGDPKLLTPNASGPGELTVPEGFAVILEKNGVVSQVVEAGIHFLEKGELATMAVPLYPRTERIPVKDVMTRDRVRFDSVVVTVRHKVAGTRDLYENPTDTGKSSMALVTTEDALKNADKKDGAKKDDAKKDDAKKDSKATKRGLRYQANPDIIHYEIWNPDHKDYVDVLKGYVTNQVRMLIGSEYFEDLFSGFGGTRKQVQDALQTNVKSFMEKRGVTVESAAIAELNIEDRIAKALQDRKHVELDRQVKIARAQTRRDSLVIQQDAKAALRDALIRQIADPLRDKGRGVIIDAEIAVRYIEAIEHLSLTFVKEDLETQKDVIDGTVSEREPKPEEPLWGIPDAPVPPTDNPNTSPG